MKTILFTTALFLVTFLSTAQETVDAQSDETYSLTVTVPNAFNDNGKMMISLNDKTNFMRAAPTKSVEVIIKNGTATATFTEIPAGDYAVMVLHDENGNKQMDFETNGMPKEAYGMSNNPALMGMPVFEDAKFTLDGDKNMEVKLAKY
jgi:uncharacterized protein (DUF2141 family)